VSAEGVVGGAVQERPRKAAHFLLFFYKFINKFYTPGIYRFFFFASKERNFIS
jgi:hypothetical protein